MTNNNYLTMKEAAEYIGTTPNYLYKLAGQEHRIPFYKPGRKCLFKKEELDDYVQKSRVATSAEIALKVATRALK